MKLSLEDRVVLITGPAKGMGAAITHAFAAEGCKLALMGRDTAAIQPVADEVKAKGGQAIVIACDLTDASQCEAAVDATKEAFGGRIDVLVNVAGGSGPIGKTGVQTTPEEFDEIVTLNMNGCFHTMRSVLRTIRYKVFCEPPLSCSRSGSSPLPGAPLASSHRPRTPGSSWVSPAVVIVRTPHSLRGE